MMMKNVIADRFVGTRKLSFSIAHFLDNVHPKHFDFENTSLFLDDVVIFPLIKFDLQSNFNAMSLDNFADRSLLASSTSGI